MTAGHCEGQNAVIKLGRRLTNIEFGRCPFWMVTDSRCVAELAGLNHIETIWSERETDEHGTAFVAAVIKGLNEAVAIRRVCQGSG